MPQFFHRNTFSLAVVAFDSIHLTADRYYAHQQDRHASNRSEPRSGCPGSIPAFQFEWTAAFEQWTGQIGSTNLFHLRQINIALGDWDLSRPAPGIDSDVARALIDIKRSLAGTAATCDITVRVWLPSALGRPKFATFKLCLTHPGATLEMVDELLANTFDHFEMMSSHGKIPDKEFAAFEKQVEFCERRLKGFVEEIEAAPVTMHRKRGSSMLGRMFGKLGGGEDDDKKVGNASANRPAAEQGKIVKSKGQEGKFFDGSKRALSRAKTKKTVRFSYPFYKTQQKPPNPPKAHVTEDANDNSDTDTLVDGLDAQIHQAQQCWSYSSQSIRVVDTNSPRPPSSSPTQSDFSSASEYEDVQAEVLPHAESPNPSFFAGESPSYDSSPAEPNNRMIPPKAAKRLGMHVNIPLEAAENFDCGFYDVPEAVLSYAHSPTPSLFREEFAASASALAGPVNLAILSKAAQRLGVPVTMLQAAAAHQDSRFDDYHDERLQYAGSPRPSFSSGESADYGSSSTELPTGSFNVAIPSKAAKRLGVPMTIPSQAATRLDLPAKPATPINYTAPAIGTTAPATKQQGPLHRTASAIAPPVPPTSQVAKRLALRDELTKPVSSTAPGIQQQRPIPRIAPAIAPAIPQRSPRRRPPTPGFEASTRTQVSGPITPAERQVVLPRFTVQLEDCRFPSVQDLTMSKKAGKTWRAVKQGLHNPGFMAGGDPAGGAMMMGLRREEGD